MMNDSEGGSHFSPWSMLSLPFLQCFLLSVLVHLQWVSLEIVSAEGCSEHFKVLTVLETLFVSDQTGTSTLRSSSHTIINDKTLGTWPQFGHLGATVDFIKLNVNKLDLFICFTKNLIPRCVSTVVNNTLKPWLNCMIFRKLKQNMSPERRKRKSVLIWFTAEAAETKNLKDTGLLEWGKASPSTNYLFHFERKKAELEVGKQP